MKKTTASLLNLLLLTAPVLFSGCAYHAYFLSPFHATGEPYHTIPLKSDSLRSATYASGVFTEGGANSRLRDNVFSFTGSLHRSHNFGNFQAFYGANIALGSYNTGNYDYNDRRPPIRYDTLPRILKANSKFFGGYGAGGGIDFALPFGRGSEWRVVGVSFTLEKEFGDYWSFRKTLPDSLADATFNNNLVGLLGLSTELAFKVRHGMIGYKLMVAGDVLNGYGGSHYKGVDSTQYGMIFFQQSLSFTHERVTGSFQVNVGNHVMNAQLGVGYRLGRREKNPFYRYEP